MNPATTPEVNAGWRNIVYLVASLLLAAIGVYGLVVMGTKPHWIFVTVAASTAVVVGVAKIVGVIE